MWLSYPFYTAGRRLGCQLAGRRSGPVACAADGCTEPVPSTRPTIRCRVGRVARRPRAADRPAPAARAPGHGRPDHGGRGRRGHRGPDRPGCTRHRRRRRLRRGPGRRRRRGSPCRRRPGSRRPGPPRSTWRGRSTGPGRGRPVAEAVRAGRRGRRDQPGASARTGPRSCPPARNVLTHCNAGGLATVGYGTAIGVVRAAHERRARSPRLGRRDPSGAAGRAADRLGAAAAGHPRHAGRRRHGGLADGVGRRRPGHRRRRPHRRQRRRRQQDRHLRPGGARPPPRRALLRGRAVLHARPRHGPRRRHPDRAAQPRGGHDAGRPSGGAGRLGGREPCLRRDPRRVGHRLHQRARGRPPPASRSAPDGTTPA